MQDGVYLAQLLKLPKPQTSLVLQVHRLLHLGSSKAFLIQRERAQGLLLDSKEESFFFLLWLKTGSSPPNHVPHTISLATQPAPDTSSSSSHGHGEPGLLGFRGPCTRMPEVRERRKKKARGETGVKCGLEGSPRLVSFPAPLTSLSGNSSASCYGAQSPESNAYQRGSFPSAAAARRKGSGRNSCCFEVTISCSRRSGVWM